MESSDHPKKQGETENLASRKLNFNKMKKISSIIGVALVTSFLFTSCIGTTKSSNTVGDWYYEISRNMGGYQISLKTKLTIKIFESFTHILYQI